MKSTLAVFALVLAVPVLAHGQQVTCDVVARPSTRTTGYQLPGGAYNVFYGGGGIPMRCPSRGITLVADSVEAYGQDRVVLIGRVDYREPRLRVRADHITYFMTEDRVFATGNVVATLPSGSTLRGPQAEYRRASARVRPVAELEAVNRPTITIVPQQGAGGPRTQPGDTTTVTANRLFMRGDSLLYASGRVDIERPDFGATGDSVFMNTVTEYMQLMRDPAIEGKQGRPFRLTGTLIDLYSRNRQLDRVVARGAARGVSEDMTLTSDTIQFDVADDLLQAAYAWGRTRPAEALSQTQRITADSIAVGMPAQRVRRLAALGRAHAEAEADTIRFHTTEKDWLRGDTIIARFDSVSSAQAADSAAARDTSAGSHAAPTARDTTPPRIRELLAIGTARSYQLLPPRDSTLRCPAINYVRGDSIRVTFDSGEVRTVRVMSENAAPGVLAEPDSTCGRATPVGADTTGTPRGAVRPAPPASTPDPRHPAPDSATGRPRAIAAPAPGRGAPPAARPQPSTP